ncbi:MAG TPA: hypothetical protein VLC09_08840 [Polyangiaceae bacterium]|nr:hypothetical protein [Polyangiaceae bacterium]
MSFGRLTAAWGVALALGCGARSELWNEDAGPADNTGGAPATGGSPGTGGEPALQTACELIGDDPRVAGIRPDQIATLDAADFVSGDATSYHWRVEMEDCDAIVSDSELFLQGENERLVHFRPSRPAIYRFTLDAVGVDGVTASCELNVPVEGIGLRVELCWNTSTTTDLDLYLHTPHNEAPWFAPGSFNVIEGLDENTCNTSNATASLRDQPRVDWGYPDSPLSACNTTSFEGFLTLGRCPNPRAADDNNQQIATGTTERMQLDNPFDGQTFRVMAQNFSNGPAQPHVFVYCGGERVGAFQAPIIPLDFRVPGPGDFGVMWRATDITAHVDATGRVSCTALALRNSLSIDDTRY